MRAIFLSLSFIFLLSGCGYSSEFHVKQNTDFLSLPAEEQQLIGVWVETFPDGSRRGVELYTNHTWAVYISVRDEESLAGPFQRVDEGTWELKGSMVILTAQTSTDAYASFRVDTDGRTIPKLIDTEHEDYAIYKVQNPI